MLHFSCISNRRAVALAGFLALSSCNGVVQYVVDGPPGKSDAQVHADNQECLARLGNVPDHDELFVRCVYEHGDTPYRDGRVVSPLQGDGFPTFTPVAASTPQALWDDLHTAQADTKVGNDAAALPLWRKFEAQATDPEDLSMARWQIGQALERGNTGVPRDYVDAARWFQKAIDTKNHHGDGVFGGFWARKNLGLLYAYGFGVPRDRAKARQLWEEMGEDVWSTIVRGGGSNGQSAYRSW